MIFTEVIFIMKVTVNTATPIKQSDGSWKVVLKTTEEEIPDKGRGSVFCNACVQDAFPECRKWCTAYLPADEQKKLHAERYSK